MDPTLHAATAGAVTCLITTTLVNVYSGGTAAGRVEALQNLCQRVQSQHDHFVNVVLPALEKAGRSDACARGVDHATRQLMVQRSKVDEIVARMSNASFFQKHWRYFMSDAIQDSMDQLKDLDQNALRRTTKANEILDRLGDAVFSPEGITIQDGQGNTLNYHATPVPNPGEVRKNFAPKEEPTPAPDKEVAVSTSSVVAIR